MDHFANLEFTGENPDVLASVEIYMRPCRRVRETLPQRLFISVM